MYICIHPLADLCGQLRFLLPFVYACACRKTGFNNHTLDEQSSPSGLGQADEDSSERADPARLGLSLSSMSFPFSCQPVVSLSLESSRPFLVRKAILGISLYTDHAHYTKNFDHGHVVAFTLHNHPIQVVCVCVYVCVYVCVCVCV